MITVAVVESGGCFVLMFGRNLASVAMKIFKFNYFVKIFDKFGIFSVICKDNSAINVLMFNTKSFILVKFDGSYTRLVSS